MRLFGSLMASPTIGPLTMAEDRPELHAAGPLALAGAFADRLAEQFEEAARQLDVAVEQLRRPRARRQARQLRLRAGRPVDRVVQHLGRQPAGDGVRVVDVVVLVPLVGGDRELVGAALADRLDQLAARRSRSRRTPRSGWSSSSGLVGGLPARMSSIGSMMPTPSR